MSSSIYITTLTDERIDYTFVFKTYGLRWRIEIIFKCWKSNMGFDKIHNVSKIQLNVLLLARFIMIVCTQLIFGRCLPIIKKHFKWDLSLLKLTKYLLRHTIKILSILKEISDPDNRSEGAIKAIAKYCTYEKRHRQNYQQKMDALFC